MMANEPETALYRAPTFTLLLASHGGLVHTSKRSIKNKVVAHALFQTDKHPWKKRRFPVFFRLPHDSAAMQIV